MSLKENLNTLAASAAELNKFSDDVYANLTALETRINEMQLGVEAWVQSDRLRVGYMRMRECQGGWNLVVSEGDQTTWTILSQANRSLRLRASYLMDALIEKLISKTKEVLTDTTHAAGVTAKWSIR